jgi:hypothetical protein
VSIHGAEVIPREEEALEMTRKFVSTAIKAASRFRVEQTEEGVILVDRQDKEHRVQLRPTAVRLTIEAHPSRICRSLVPDGLERWVTLKVEELSIGIEDDRSAVSVWAEDEADPYHAENSIFGIEDADLEHLVVTHARVVDLDAIDRDGSRYIEDSTESTKHDGQDDAEQQDVKDHGPVADLWYHTGGDETSGDRWSALVLTVGFPEPQFSELIDACASGRADTLFLECHCYAKSTGWAFQSARDMILSAGESVRLQIDEATMSAPVLAVAPQRRPIESGDNGGRKDNDNEQGQ